MPLMKFGIQPKSHEEIWDTAKIARDPNPQKISIKKKGPVSCSQNSGKQYQEPGFGQAMLGARFRAIYVFPLSEVLRTSIHYNSGQYLTTRFGPKSHEDIWDTQPKLYEEF
jgi:hypothetical protein